MRRTLALTAFLLSIGCASTAPPRDFPKPQNQAQLDARLGFLEERLDAGRLHAALWNWGWLGIQVLSGISQIQDATQADKSGDRDRDAVNAFKSAVGVTDILLIRPMPGIWGAGPLRAMPAATEDERLAQLERGEEILRAAAERAAARRSWQVHVGNLLFNLACSGVLLGLGHGEAAGITLATGTIGGEIQIWTEPWRGTRDLADYEHLVESGHASAPDPGQHWHLAPAQDGLALEMRF